MIFQFRCVCRSSSTSFNAANALSAWHVNVGNVVLTHNIITQDFVWKPAGVTPARGVLLAESFDSLPHEIRHLILCHRGFSALNGFLDTPALLMYTKNTLKLLSYIFWYFGHIWRKFFSLSPFPFGEGWDRESEICVWWVLLLCPHPPPVLSV